MEEQKTIGQALDARPIYTSWHMPGHKGRAIGRFPMDQDLTELPGTDNLQHPEEGILAAEQRIAKIHGARYAYLSVQGSSGMMCAMLHACLKPGDTILAVRNAHKSFFNGCIQAGLQPVYLKPHFNSEWLITESITYEQVAEAVAEHPEAKALYITNPTYEGYWMDLTDIADLLHRHGMLLLVDEAHGAHVSYIGGLPHTAMAMGADFAVQSYHKTLPSPTQTAVLLQGNREISWERVRRAINLIQTTSPSYILMKGIDDCRCYMEALTETRIRRYWEDVARTRQAILDEPGISLYPSVDPSRIVFRVDGADPNLVYEALREKGMELEGVFGDSVMVISSIMDRTEDFDLLIQAVRQVAAKFQSEKYIKNGLEQKKYLSNCENYDIMPLSNTVMSLRDAFYAEEEMVPIEEAKGRISASFITPYPPGIPVVCPGELMSPEIVSYIVEADHRGLEVLGLTQGSVSVLSERRPCYETYSGDHS